MSRLLSLKVRHPNRQSALSREKKADSPMSDNVDGQEKTTTKACVSQDTHEWLLKFKDFDMNWVE